jgi:preprotein translocase subunit SecB
MNALEFPVIPSFKVIKIYLKSSFIEQPNSPQIFTLANSPENSYEVDISNESISNDTHEVSITVTLTAKTYNQVSYIVNIKQCGLFQFENVSPEIADDLLNINCPSLLMPQLKSNLSDFVLRSGSTHSQSMISTSKQFMHRRSFTVSYKRAKLSLNNFSNCSLAI